MLIVSVNARSYGQSGTERASWPPQNILESSRTPRRRICGTADLVEYRPLPLMGKRARWGESQEPGSRIEGSGLWSRAGALAEVAEVPSPISFVLKERPLTEVTSRRGRLCRHHCRPSPRYREAPGAGDDRDS